jgi:uncharacterized repeat protein (TIGR01451 family)
MTSPLGFVLPVRRPAGVVPARWDGVVRRVAGQSALYMVVLAVVGALAAGTSSTALAASTIDVAMTGADSPTCGSAAAPCQTIGYAYTVRANDGDTIKVAAGQYGSSNPSDPNPTLRKYLFIRKTIHFVGAQAGVDARTRTEGGPGETVIYNDLPNNASAELWYIGAPGVTVDGFTFDDVTPGPGHYELQFGGAGIQTKNELGGNPTYPVESDGWQITNTIFHMTDIGLYAGAAGTIPSLVEHDLFDDTGGSVPSNTGDAGIYSDHPLINTVITENRFVGDKTANPVLIATAYATPSSKVTISDNVMDGQGSVSLFNVVDTTITDNSMRHVYRGVAIAGGDHGITVSGNTITEPSSVDPALKANCILLGDPYGIGENSDVTVFDNILVGCVTGGITVSNTHTVKIDYNLITGTQADAIDIVPNTDSYLPPNAPIPLTGDVTVTRNTIDGSKGFGVSVAAGSYTGPMLVRYNRIINNGHYDGLTDDDSSASIDARWNWWGCNSPDLPSPPTSPGCGTVKGAAASAVTWSPWLILTIASNPADVMAGVPATISSDVHTDSNGAIVTGLDVPPSPFFRPVPDRFTAAIGSVTPGTVQLSRALDDSTHWPAGQARPTMICSMVDYQTVCLTWPSITIEKRADREQLQPGGVIGYRITVRDPGRVAAWNVRVCDNAPRQLRLMTATRRLRHVGRSLCTVLPHLAPHEHTSLHLTFRVARDAGGEATIDNTATATPNEAVATAPTGTGAALSAHAQSVVRVVAHRGARRPPRFTG